MKRTLLTLLLIVSSYASSAGAAIVNEGQRPVTRKQAAEAVDGVVLLPTGYPRLADNQERRPAIVTSDLTQDPGDSCDTTWSQTCGGSGCSSNKVCSVTLAACQTAYGTTCKINHGYTNPPCTSC
jgi:hypothetical protein